MFPQVQYCFEKQLLLLDIKVSQIKVTERAMKYFKFTLFLTQLDHE